MITWSLSTFVSAYFNPLDCSKLLTTDQYDQIRVYSSSDWSRPQHIIQHPHRQFQHLTPIKVCGVLQQSGNWQRNLLYYKASVVFCLGNSSPGHVAPGLRPDCGRPLPWWPHLPWRWEDHRHIWLQHSRTCVSVAGSHSGRDQICK